MKAWQPDWGLAFVLSPIAGAAAVFVVTALYAVTQQQPNQTGLMLLAGGGLFAVYGLILSVMYTLVVGGLIVAWVVRTGKVLSRMTAIAIGLMTGFLPFAACAVGSFHDSTGWHVSDLFSGLFIPFLALGASVANAWSFWALGMKNRKTRPDVQQQPVQPPS